MRRWVWLRAGLFAALVAVAADIGRRLCPFQRLVAEPRGLAAKLQALPRRGLSTEDRARFEHDGFVALPGLLADSELLATLRAALWRGGFPPHNASLPNGWVSNGALRSLIRDGPLGALAASALGVRSVRIGSSACFYKKPMGRNGSLPSQAFHVDSVLTGSGSSVVTAWVALTDAPSSLEILRGSHKVLHGCPYKLSHSQKVQLDCIEGEYAANLSQARGAESRWIHSAAAGDVLLLDGRLWHRGYSHPAERLAVSLRFWPAQTRFERELVVEFGVVYYGSFLPQECDNIDGPLFPVVFPLPESTVDSMRWPLLVTWRELIGSRLKRGAYELSTLLGRSTFREC